jgi:5-methylcytosine-specific restriction endonuclease McrA
MLTRDQGWSWVSRGHWFLKRWYLQHRKLGEGLKLKDGEYRALLAQQATVPVLVALQDRRRCWMYEGDYYWEDDGLTAEEVKALLLDRQRRRRKQIDNAVSRMYMDVAASSSSRLPIPDDVKLFVWTRDGGRCVRCGSQIDLEFDHVIPLAMGGSNSARNLQVLCATCNRAKGASIV